MPSKLTKCMVFSFGNFIVFCATFHLKIIYIPLFLLLKIKLYSLYSALTFTFLSFPLCIVFNYFYPWFTFHVNKMPIRSLLTSRLQKSSHSEVCYTIQNLDKTYFSSTVMLCIHSRLTIKHMEGGSRWIKNCGSPSVSTLSIGVVNSDCIRRVILSTITNPENC